MMNFYQNIPFSGFGYNPQTNGSCGVPVECCCGGGVLQIKPKDKDHRFLSFDGLIGARDPQRSYDAAILMDFKITDLSNNVVVYTMPDAINMGNSPFIPSAAIAVNSDFEILKITLNSSPSQGQRGITLLINSLATATIGARYKVEYRVKFKTNCDEIELTDCAFINIVACEPSLR